MAVALDEANPEVAAMACNVGQSVARADGRLVHVLEGVNLTLPCGQIVAIVGRNGVGKSTLARIFAGLQTPSTGHVQWHGNAIQVPRCAISMQEIDESLLPWRTNLRNITIGLEAFGVPTQVATERGRAFVERYRLPVPLDEHPGTSSGGHRQMVSAVRAAIVKPALLILDEPFSRIDPTQVWLWRQFLLDYVSDSGSACMIITHSLDDALYVADEVTLLSRSGDRGATIVSSVRVSVGRARRRDWRRTSDYADLRQRLADEIEAL